MLDGLSINGVKPVDDRPSRNPRGGNRKYEQKFSMEEDGAEKESDKNKKQAPQTRPGKAKQPAPAANKKENSIDIVI